MWIVLLTGIALAGCGQKGPVLSKVEGKVYLGAKALTRGTVIFYPDASKGNNSQEEPRAEIDEEGRYALKTHVKDGAAPGWYQVAVTAAKQIDPKNPYFTDWLIPERYIDRKTSKLAFEVVAEPQANAYDIRLKTK